MATYRTGDFRKGLKVQIDGEPYLMSEMNFRKPGKGNAIYECTLKNLIRGTTLKRVYRGGDELESAGWLGSVRHIGSARDRYDEHESKQKDP